MASERFTGAYQRWTSMPFPDGSDDDGLDELHAQLAYADAMVAEAAEPIAKNRARSGRVPDQVVLELLSVISRAAEYASSDSEGYVRLASTYSIYADALLEVIDALG